MTDAKAVRTESLTIPFDRAAEEAVVGASIRMDRSWASAWTVMAEDFYDPQLGRIFQACLNVNDIFPFTGPTGPSYVRVRSTYVRAGALSVLADVPLERVIRLAEETPGWSDVGRWALRVRKAARLRKAMHASAAAFNAIGSGAPVEQATGLLEAAQRELASA